jgi:hypothetical protein
MSPLVKYSEEDACKATPVDPSKFNSDAVLPHGLEIEHIQEAVSDFVGFLTLVNDGLHGAGLPRFESFAMPANFSSIVGEFMIVRMAEHCSGLAKNAYHNGHPDLVPVGVYGDDSVLHGDHGIEVKGSRYYSGWQGHNAEDTWLMVFVFDVNSPNDSDLVRPFRLRRVLGAQLEQSDWSEAGRGEESRRTPTASVVASGSQKMTANWIYWAD